MLPTPDTSHVSYERIYEPAEDSFLFLDTLSSDSERAFLTARFGDDTGGGDAGSGANSSEGVQAGDQNPKHHKPQRPAPLVLEVGPGSGVVVAFAAANAAHIFGTRAGGVLASAVDVNGHACAATRETVRRACRFGNKEQGGGRKEESSAEAAATSLFLGAAQGDLTAPLRDGSVDVLIFNPPYVPTPEMPQRPGGGSHGAGQQKPGGEGEQGSGPPSRETAQRPTAAAPELDASTPTTWDGDSYLLALSYAGGADGMETTVRLLAQLPRVLAARGVAYVLLCAQNRPEEVKAAVRRGDYFPPKEDKDREETRWLAETVGSSGKTAGWEKLQIVRIWRADEEEAGP